jgi:hypothetical protein
MPAEQRAWGDEERAPARARKEPARGGEKGSIDWSQARSSDLTAQDGELVTEDDDLQLLELARAEAERGQFQETPENEVAERQWHGQDPPRRCV